MGSIDASAIASIGSVRSMPMSSGGIEPQRPALTLAGQTSAGPGEPARTSDRVLRVVFPAHVDADGIYREEAAAHAVVEASEWAAVLGARPDAARNAAGLRSAGIIPASATAAPTGAAAAATPGTGPQRALATLDEIIAARAAGTAGGSLPGPIAGSIAASIAASPVSPSPSAQSPAPPRPVVMAFTALPSRGLQPQSLAEAAAGLEAPRIPRLDPSDPGANSDTPDVVAVASQPGTSISAASSDRASVRRTLKAGMEARHMAPPATVDSAAPVTAAAPFGSRPVRWKGRTYDLPYRNPQAASAAAAPTKDQCPNPTAELNKEALARTASPRSQTVASNMDPGVPAAVSNTTMPGLAATSSYAPTDSASVAKARVEAMAAPLIARAADAGRTAVDAGGMKLPLPATARGWSALAQAASPSAPRPAGRPADDGNAAPAGSDAGTPTVVSPGDPQ
jgi:conjugal transfer pilus assembly protein TraV